MKLVKITSKKQGFRRCGIAHSTTPTTYPLERFVGRQLEALRSDPMLDVEIVDVPDEEPVEEPEPAPEPEQKPERKGKKR